MIQKHKHVSITILYGTSSFQYKLDSKIWNSKILKLVWIMEWKYIDFNDALLPTWAYVGLCLQEEQWVIKISVKFMIYTSSWNIFHSTLQLGT